MSDKEKYTLLIEALKAKAKEILPKGSRLVLFGSRARGDATSESDWDLHVMVPGPEKMPWSQWDIYACPFSDVGLEFDEIVNPCLYSLSGWLKRKFMPFYNNVEREAVVIYQS